MLTNIFFVIGWDGDEAESKSNYILSPNLNLIE
jgi:hypothetical protein